MFLYFPGRPIAPDDDVSHQIGEREMATEEVGFERVEK
jgi:hypothetical protein